MTRERRTAGEAYAEQRRLVTLRIAQLEQELARLDEGQRSHASDWSYAGTIGITQARLLELVAMLRGIEPHEVVP